MDSARDLQAPPIRHKKEKLAKALDKAGNSGVPGLDVPARNPFLVHSEQYPNLVKGDTIPGIRGDTIEGKRMLRSKGTKYRIP